MCGVPNKSDIFFALTCQFFIACLFLCNNVLLYSFGQSDALRCGCVGVGVLRVCLLTNEILKEIMGSDLSPECRFLT